MQLFPNNTAAEFETQLASAVSCGPGQYEAAMTEIIFPNDFHKKLRVDAAGGDWSITCHAGKNKILTFKPVDGEYDDVFAVLVSAMEKPGQIGRIFVKRHKLGFLRLWFFDHTYTGPVARAQASRTMHPNEVVFGTELRKLLEVSDVLDMVNLPIQFLLTDKSKSFFGPTIEHIYVYSDIIQPRETGGKLEPLLRSVAVTGEKDRFQTVEYSKPHYFPLAKSSFRNIKVWILDKDGKRVQFRQSPVIIVLNIRRVASPI